MEFANKANFLAIQQHTGAAAGVHRRVLSRLEHGLGRCQQGFYIALDVVEIHLGFCPAPLQLVGSAVGQTRHAHGLVKALDGGVGVDHGVVLEEHAPQLKHAYALGLAVDVELKTCSKEPSSDERITLKWLAMGLSSLMALALPASSCSHFSSTKLKLMV